jgi:hypothetical protein
MVRAKPWARVDTQLDGDAFAFPASGRLVLNVADPGTLRQLDDEWSVAPDRDLGATSYWAAVSEAPPGMVAKRIPTEARATPTSVADALRD